MRVLLFADTHLGFDYPLKPRVPVRHRGQEFFDNFDAVLRHAVAIRPDLVVHGGDLFFRSRVPRPIMDMAYDRLLRFAAHGIPLVLVPGNHERGRLPGSLWLSAPNVQVLDEPKTVEIEAGGTAVALSGFPCVREDVRDRFPALVEETGYARSAAPLKLLCLHQAVEGAQVGPSDHTFRSGSDVVRASDIPRGFAAVLAGHIHRRQILGVDCRSGERRPPVIYPGSIERTSFAERYEPKGFYEIALAPDEAGRWGLRRALFQPLPARPMVDVIIDGGLQSQAELRASLQREIAGLDRDAVVRLRCQGAAGDALGRHLTAAFLRAVFPETMIVQLGAELRPYQMQPERIPTGVPE